MPALHGVALHGVALREQTLPTSSGSSPYFTLRLVAIFHQLLAAATGGPSPSAGTVNLTGVSSFVSRLYLAML